MSEMQRDAEKAKISFVLINNSDYSGCNRQGQDICGETTYENADRSAREMGEKENIQLKVELRSKSEIAVSDIFRAEQVQLGVWSASEGSMADANRFLEEQNNSNSKLRRSVTIA